MKIQVPLIVWHRVMSELPPPVSGNPRGAEIVAVDREWYFAASAPLPARISATGLNTVSKIVLFNGVGLKEPLSLFFRLEKFLVFDGTGERVQWAWVLQTNVEFV